jgi:hypothetical protein
MVMATDRKERLRRIADRLDADYDDYYLGVEARVTVPATSSQPLLAHAPAPPVAAAGPELAPRNPSAGGTIDVAPALASALLCTGMSCEVPPADKVLPANSLSELQKVYAAHSARLASALEIMSSYCNSLYYECTVTAAALRSIIEETSILEVLSPLHPDGLAPDTLPGLLAAASAHRKRLAGAFWFVSSLADWLDEDCGIGSGNDLRAVFEASGILRILDPEHVSSVARIEIAGNMASPKDTADQLADHLDDYYLPPDECYDSPDDDELAAEDSLSQPLGRTSQGGRQGD